MEHVQILERKVCVITGGGGVGLGIAQEFVEQGASVVVTGRRLATLAEPTATLGPKLGNRRRRLDTCRGGGDVQSGDGQKARLLVGSAARCMMLRLAVEFAACQLSGRPNIRPSGAATGRGAVSRESPSQNLSRGLRFWTALDARGRLCYMPPVCPVLVRLALG